MEVRPARWAVRSPATTSRSSTTTANRVKAGEVGNIVVRCEPERPVGLFPGYHKDPDATAEAFRGPYYFTGDKAARTRTATSGSRAATMTSSPPAPTASARSRSRACSSTSGRDGGRRRRQRRSERTQIVTAFCILPRLRVTGSRRELKDFVKHGTAPYKYPREIHFVEELPKTISGKIRRLSFVSGSAPDSLSYAALAGSVSVRGPRGGSTAQPLERAR